MTGKTIAHYEIIDKLGEGGMGVVYRARDTKLGRDVALKVLPEKFARDPQRMGRFEREARVLASLNHPNIAAIHGLEESNGVRALVMELVEGPTLADRIDEGAIPLDEALPLARQMADALEYAHEKGVVHRDLKPANVKVTEDGTIKVLDFGLAKAMADDLSASDPENSPTLTMGATRAGVILGTAAYMSPEQARGKTADKRADIWSFGVVLYEMLTGAQMFSGETISDTLAGVLRAEIDLSNLPEETPSAIRKLVRRCLERDRKQRLRDIGDARIEIEEAATAEPEQSSQRLAPQPARSRLPWALAVAIVCSLVTGIVVWMRSRPEPPAVVRLSIPLAADQNFSNTGRQILTISPDGTRVVYQANGAFWLRTLDELRATLIPGPEAGARNPFFSPDGRSIGFWNAGQLEKVPVTGGAPVALCSAMSLYGASWGADDMILFGQGSEGIWRVPAAGGTPEQLISVDAGEVAHGPQALPGGEWILFTLLGGGGDWDQAQIVVESLETHERTVLIESGRDARYIPTGHLVYTVDNVLFAVPFDPGARRVIGETVPLIEGVQQAGPTGTAQFGIAASGALVYVPRAFTGGDRRLIWVSRDGGGVEPAVDEPIDTPEQMRLSPDGQQLALATGANGGDLWIYDLAGRPPTPLSYEGFNGFTVWHPDGKRVAWASMRAGVHNMFWMPADSSTLEPERLLTSQNPQFTGSFSPDGRELVFTELRPETGSDILALPLDGEREPRVVVGTQYEESTPALSPNGQWLAYVSNVTGAQEVWVRPYPGSGAPVRISQNGGIQPVWGRDGQELFYIERLVDGTLTGLMGVPVSTGAEFRFEPARVLVDGGFVVFGDQNRMYDVAADGRFLMVEDDRTQEEGPSIVVVLNWLNELKRLAPRSE